VDKVIFSLYSILVHRDIAISSCRTRVDAYQVAGCWLNDARYDVRKVSLTLYHMSTTFRALDVSSRSLTLEQVEDSVLRLSQRQALPSHLPFPCFEKKYSTVGAESVTVGIWSVHRPLVVGCAWQGVEEN
jgi:hypothetical protein